MRRPSGDLRRIGRARQPPSPSPCRARRRPGRSHRPLLPQLHRGDRDHARRVQTARGRRERQLPLRRERVAVPVRQRRPGGRSSTNAATPTGWPPSCRTPRTSATRSSCEDGSDAPFTGAAYEAALAAEHPGATSANAAPTTSTSSSRAAPPVSPKGVMWRHEDVWRVLGGGIDFVTGEPCADEWAQSSAEGIGGLIRLCLRAADPRRRPVGRARRAVRRRHRRAHAAVRPARGVAGHRPAQGARGDDRRRRHGPAADRGLPARALRRLVAVRDLQPAPRCSRPSVKEQYLEALPNVVITDAIGSSESGFNGLGMVTKGAAASNGGPRVTSGPNTIVIDDDNRPVAPGEVGRLARGGHVPLGYYKDPEKTRGDLRRGRRRAIRVPGDFARTRGRRHDHPARPRQRLRSTRPARRCSPRRSRAPLKSHPDVFDALVVGVPDERLGQRVAALVQPRADRELDLAALDAHVRDPGRRLQDAAQRLVGRRDRPSRRAASPTTAGPRSTRPSTNLTGRHRCAAPLCDTFGIEHPIFGFTPSEHVAAAISRAGGLGVLGCVRYNDPADLDAALDWMDDNTDGRPYGVDIVMPAKIPTEGTPADLGALIPAGHKDFVERDAARSSACRRCRRRQDTDAGVLGWLHSVARSHVDVALNAPVAADRQRARLAAAGRHRAGARGTASRWRRWPARPSTPRGHVDNGVDIVVAQGYEAGGHTGEIATMVLLPEVVDAVGDAGAGAGGRRHRQRPPGRRRAGARRVRRVDGLVLADHGRVQPWARRPRAHAARAAGGRLERHRPVPDLHRQAGAPAQEPLDPGLGGRRTRPSRCPCRCRTCWSARRTSG